VRKKSLSKVLVTTFLLIIIAISIIWIKTEKSNSYTEPNEALFAIEKDLLLIPAYKLNEGSLFFFIKDKNYLGAAFVNEGPFGWKAGTLTWRTINNKGNYHMLNSYQVHGENLIYGLINNGAERLIKFDEKEANMLNLEMLPTNVVKEYQLEGMYIWYFESDTTLNNGELKLLDKNTGETINTIPFK
jgi:hypothetical protein